MPVSREQRDAAKAAMARMSEEHREAMRQAVHVTPTKISKPDPTLQAMIDQAVAAALANAKGTSE